MASLSEKVFRRVFQIFLLLSVCQTLLSHAYLRSVRIEEIPFSLADAGDKGRRSEALKLVGVEERTGGIHAISSLEQRRGFFHVFHVPHIVCFFAAKGKWPFIPSFLQPRVDEEARTFFKHNDSYIQQFCQKFIHIKECFRPIFAGNNNGNNDVEQFGNVRSTPCTCTNEPIIYFDRDQIGNVGRDTILDTIEFLENFLEAPATPTKRTKKKNNRVRSILDEIDIE